MCQWTDQGQSLGIGQAHILTGHHDQPSRDVQRVFTSGNHPAPTSAVLFTVLLPGQSFGTYRASQYMAALPSDPLIHLCSAEIMSYRSSPDRSYPFRKPLRTASISLRSRSSSRFDLS